jgi:hypothetical protein
VTAYLAPILELELRGVFDAGVPNKERIVLRASQPVEVGAYALILGNRSASAGHVTPLAESLYWFGSAVVPAEDWLMVYTGRGQATKVPTTDGKSMIWVGYWGRQTTIFHDRNIVPVLWRLNGISIERSS